MRLKFEMKRIKIDLEFRYPVVIVEGKSASGKTFLASLLNSYLYAGRISGKATKDLIGFNSVIFIDAFTQPEGYTLINTPGRNLVIIDNCDYLMNLDHELLCDMILDNNQNYYLLYGRFIAYLPMSKDGFADLHFDEESKTFTLIYKDRSLGSNDFQQTQLC